VRHAAQVLEGLRRRVRDRGERLARERVARELARHRERELDRERLGLGAMPVDLRQERVGARRDRVERDREPGLRLDLRLAPPVRKAAPVAARLGLLGGDVLRGRRRAPEIRVEQELRRRAHQ
jgi:hypothetical protein